MKSYRDEIEYNFSHLSDERLLQIIHADYQEYEEIALEIAKSILTQRNVNYNSSPLTKANKEASEKTLKAILEGKSTLLINIKYSVIVIITIFIMFNLLWYADDIYFGITHKYTSDLSIIGNHSDIVQDTSLSTGNWLVRLITYQNAQNRYNIYNAIKYINYIFTHIITLFFLSVLSYLYYLKLNSNRVLVRNYFYGVKHVFLKLIFCKSILSVIFIIALYIIQFFLLIFTFSFLNIRAFNLVILCIYILPYPIFLSLIPVIINENSNIINTLKISLRNASHRYFLLLIFSTIIFSVYIPYGEHAFSQFTLIYSFDLLEITIPIITCVKFLLELFAIQFLIKRYKSSSAAYFRN